MLFIHGTLGDRLTETRGTVMFSFGVYFVHSRDLLILVDAGDASGDVSGSV